MTEPFYHRCLREPVLVIPLLLFGLIHFGLFSHAMLGSSLWIDEIISIRDYSGQGPLASLTTYKEPNNHIFFNFLQSLMPWRGSYNPLSARFLPFLFTISGVCVCAIFLIRRQRWLEGALIAAMCLGSASLLAVLLNARGYGLQFLITSGLLWTATRYLEHPSRNSLNSWVVLSVLGSWVAPSFLLFWISFAGLFGVVARSRNVLLAIALSSLLIVLTYLPVGKEFFVAYTGYAEEHGQFFQNWSGVLRVSEIWTGRQPVWVVWVVYILPLLSWLGLILKGTFRVRSLEGVALMAYFSFVLALCLARLDGATPPRVFAGFLPAIILPVVVLLGAFLRQWISARSFNALAVVICFSVIFVFPGVGKLSGVTYMPIENWKGTADLIKLAFPSATRVYSYFRPELLELYLNYDYTLVDSYDESLFNDGKLVVVDSDFNSRSRKFESLMQPEWGIVGIPQMRNGFQAVLFAPQTMEVKVSFKEKEGESTTGSTLSVLLDGSNSTSFTVVMIETTTVDQSLRAHLSGTDHPSARIKRVQWFSHWLLIEMSEPVNRLQLALEAPGSMTGRFHLR